MSSQTTITEAPELNASLLPSLNDATPHGGSSRIPPITAVLLTRAIGHRAMSVLVREAAAAAYMGYSKPVVAFGMLWNIVAMLACTVDERLNMPIWVWVLGYSLQCMLHKVLICLEYRCRSQRAARDVESGGNRNGGEGSSSGGVGGGNSRNSSLTRFIIEWQSLNIGVSFIWCFLGLYWVFTGGYIHLQDAPHLFWLAVVFLALDVTFTIFIIAILEAIEEQAIEEQKGASEADLSILAKYRFIILSKEEKPTGGAGTMVPIETGSGYSANEQMLLPEDAECCICLCSYKDGEELHALPCNHHFHSACIVNWLKMNAICALCKYDLFQGSEQE